jgi:hypothetical protein
MDRTGTAALLTPDWSRKKSAYSSSTTGNKAEVYTAALLPLLLTPETAPDAADDGLLGGNELTKFFIRSADRQNRCRQIFAEDVNLMHD